MKRHYINSLRIFLILCLVFALHPCNAQNSDSLLLNTIDADIAQLPAGKLPPLIKYSGLELSLCGGYSEGGSPIQTNNNNTRVNPDIYFSPGFHIGLSTDFMTSPYFGLSLGVGFDKNPFDSKSYEEYYGLHYLAGNTYGGGSLNITGSDYHSIQFFAGITPTIPIEQTGSIKFFIGAGFIDVTSPAINLTFVNTWPYPSESTQTIGSTSTLLKSLMFGIKPSIHIYKALCVQPSAYYLLASNFHYINFNLGVSFHLDSETYEKRQ